MEAAYTISYVTLTVKPKFILLYNWGDLNEIQYFLVSFGPDKYNYIGEFKGFWRVKYKD